MPDDKSKRGGADRRRVAAGQPYEVSYFARKHGITTDQARKIIARCGSDREKANKEAERVKRGRAQRLVLVIREWPAHIFMAMRPLTKLPLCEPARLTS